MRVTNSLFYKNATNDYQRNMQELYKTNQQISSGTKIQNSFEDSGVYVDTMRLDYKVATLEQVKESSSKAQAYANNTDQVLNQLTDSITQFKTLLLQAANESNSSTSLNAIANELSVLKEHMVSLGNTSINGQYLFSGTDVTTKPFNDDGTYNGNDENIEAIIGSGVKLPYNITGNDLFLGSDSEYNKVLSTNVKMYNQTLLHPSGNEAGKEVYLNKNDTIRDMTGDAKIQLNAYDIAGDIEAGDVYSIEINGRQISHTVTDETTSEEITAALMNAINDSANSVDTIVRATTNGARLILTAVDSTSKPTIVTDVTNRTNALTSASITNISFEIAAIAHEESTTFSLTSWDSAADSITWADGLGNSVILNPIDIADGANEDIIGVTLAAAINTDVTTGPLYTASYDVPTKKLIVTSNTLGSGASFNGTVTSVSSDVPATYSSSITNTAAGVNTNDMLTWSDNTVPLATSYTYTAIASDSTLEDMIIGLTTMIDSAGDYNASYDLAGGFTVASNTAELVASFNGSLTMDVGPAVVFGGLEVSNPGETALLTAKDPVINGNNGTPSLSTVTFSSATTNIDAGDIFEFTIDDGSGIPEIFSYTSVSNDTLDNVKTNLESQLALSTLYAGNGVNINATIDETAGTLSLEIAGNYPPGTLFDGTGVITVDAANTVDTDTDLQTITEDSIISLANGETIASFYVSGRNAQGDTFSKELQLSSSSKVSDLLEQIGQTYGNTSTNEVVEVSMNDHGQIEIKDLLKGNSLLEFNIFGAIDRNTVGTAGNASQADIDTLLAKNNVDIIEFIKSDFLNTNTASSISSNQDINNPGVFKVGAPMALANGTPVKTITTLQSFMGDEINQIEFSGTDNLGNAILPIPPNDVLKIDNTTTVEDLLTTIENIYGVPARLEDGQIYLEGDETLDYAANQLNVNISALKGAGEGEIQSLNISSGSVLGGIIEITYPSGNPQNITILPNSSASDIATQIADYLTTNPPATAEGIASVIADGNSVVFDYDGDMSSVLVAITDVGTTAITSSGNVEEIFVASGVAEEQSFNVTRNISTGGPNIITIAGQNITVNDTDTPETIATNIKAALDLAAPLGSIDSVSTIGNEVTVIYTLGANVASNFLTNTASLTGLDIGEVITEQNGGPVGSVDAFSTFDSMNYERRGFTKDGNLLSSNVSQIIKETGEYATNSTTLYEVSGTPMDGKSLELNFTDKDGNISIATINFNTIGSTFSINNGITHDILNSSGTITSANNITYQQLVDVIGIAVSGTTYDGVYDETKYNNEYEENLSDSKNFVEVNLNSKGKLEIYDKVNSESKIEFSMYDDNADASINASSLSFMSNDAIIIEEPKIDFFSELNSMIIAVREGYFSMDGDSDNPRNIGIQNSIAKIDHLMDHITKEHTKIGSYSNALSSANERSELLSINVQAVRSEVIDVDIGEAYMKFNQLSNSYQAMLSTVAKINSMTLLNYM